MKKLQVPLRTPSIASSSGKLQRGRSLTASPRLRSSATTLDPSGGGTPGKLGPLIRRMRAYGFNRLSLLTQSICRREDTVAPAFACLVLPTRTSGRVQLIQTRSQQPLGHVDFRGV